MGCVNSFELTTRQDLHYFTLPSTFNHESWNMFSRYYNSLDDIQMFYVAIIWITNYSQL